MVDDINTDLVEGLIRDATANHGEFPRDPEAAKELLRQFWQCVLTGVSPHPLVSKFIAEGLMHYTEQDFPLEKALYLKREYSGAPKQDTTNRNLDLTFMIHMKRLALGNQRGHLNQALALVARETGFSTETLRSIYKKNKRYVEDFHKRAGGWPAIPKIPINNDD